MANEKKGLIGRKIGMTQIFSAEGDVVPVTVLEIGPCTVLQVKTTDGADGYNAVQLGFGEQKAQRMTKAELGHYAKAGEVKPRFVREIRLDAASVAGASVGQVISATDLFAEGEKVDVAGTSKGKGFGGVMKRHNFRGFIRTHGTHEYFRHGGSIGTRLTPGHVLKGKRMPGQMGNVAVTVQNIKIARIDSERNLIFLAGGVPGANGSFVTIRKAVKL
jgi:large subunit ribosomal protein L3